MDQGDPRPGAPSAPGPVPIPPSLHPFPLSAVFAFGKDPIAFLGALAAQGPLAQSSLAGEKVLLVSEPELIRELMLSRAGELLKSRPFPRVKLLLGDGLFTTEGELHRSHRRLVMPAFHRQVIGHHGALLVERALALRESWQDGQEVSLHQTLSALSLDMAARALYGADLGPALGRIQKAMGVLMGHFAISTPPWLDRLKLKLPLASTLETRHSVAEMDAVLEEVLEERRRHPLSGRKDLLQMLLEARDEDGVGLNAKELRDEAMTLLLASHDTMATALTWTLAALVKNPGVQAALQKDLAEKLEGRTPTYEDYPNLGSVERVFAEALRVYPPGWVLARTPKDRFSFAGHEFRRGTLLVVCPYWLHRDPRFYPDPERFDPERFLPAAKEARPGFTYLPFSAGPRSCLGEGFAWMQAVLTLATLCQRWRFEEHAGEALKLKPAAKFLLTPDRPLKVTVRQH